MCFDDDE
jgi:hypothetical protein